VLFIIAFFYEPQLTALYAPLSKAGVIMIAPGEKTWAFLGEHRNKEGKWTTFAEDKLRRP